jgi:hypothetical protein
MTVQSEASCLWSNCELGDDAKDFVITDFELDVYLIPPHPLLFDSLKTQNLSIVSMEGPLFEMLNAFIFYLLFP